MIHQFKTYTARGEYYQRKKICLRQVNKLTENVELHKILLDISTKDKKNALTEI